MYYIQETDKPSKISKIFNKVKLKEDKIILPIEKQKIISDETARKLVYKVNKILKNANSNKLIVSKEIKKQEIFINYLYTYNFEIVDGKWLFEVLINEILEYIIQKEKLKIDEIQISFLVNQINEIILENIKESLKKYKRVNIVTNHSEKLKKIEKEYLDEYGIPICVTNNKKKSLSKSNIIINIDFPNEFINNYQIYDNAIIISILENIKIKKKRFNGYIINDYEIEKGANNLSDYNTQNIYSNKDIYEAEIYKKQPYEDIKSKIKKDKIKIVKLIAINGEI